MGLRFDLQTANWIAYLTQPKGSLPNLGESRKEREALQLLARKFDERFLSSPRRELEFHGLVTYLRGALENSRSASELNDAVTTLRRFLSDRPWTALIIPGGQDQEIDRVICSESFLRTLVDIRPSDPGLILQLEEPSRDLFSLTDIFPAFRTALAASSEWPGMLLWTSQGDSVFLPFSSRRVHDIEAKAKWIFSHLAISVGTDLEQLRRFYISEFPRTETAPKSRLVILHMSDIHIGSKEASSRLPRVQQLIRNVLAEVSGDCRVLPLITGDLMDSPEKDNLNEVRGFIDFVSNIGTDEPIIIVGNHDVRRDGYLEENYKLAFGLSNPSGRVQWFDDLKVGVLCFNSVADGQLARGYIGTEQMMDLGNAIDRKKDVDDYFLLGVLHHHPMPVERPDWYVQGFYERLLGSWFEQTLELADAKAFLEFANQRSVAAVLHGHKHIPRVGEAPNGTIVYGCGSTVGKVPETGTGTYMSINVVTIDSASGQTTCRLLAERIPGGGLTETKRHEIVSRRRLGRHVTNQ